MSNNSSSEPSQQDMNELENLYKSSQFNTLENKVEELLKKHSKNVNLYNILGVSLQVQGKLKESLKKKYEILLVIQIKLLYIRIVYRYIIVVIY